MKSNQHFNSFFVGALALTLLMVLVHSITQISPLFFIIIACSGLLILVSNFKKIPGFNFLSTLNQRDQSVIWLTLIVLGIIGYLHNANTWIADGLFRRPLNIALWKSELVLGISLFITISHWTLSFLTHKKNLIKSKEFAIEFAFYVNFSGIALLLWSGDTTLSFSTLLASLTLIALVELTLYASR